jgi:membrane-associated phospholipid phosphatase
MSFPVLPILSSVLLILGIALAASRVLLGIHFLRDVIAGAAIGIASGGIGLLVLWLI